MHPESWFGIRLVYRLTGFADPAYEERVLILRAADENQAIAKAEELSRQDYEDETTHYTGYAMVFNIFDEYGDTLGEGVEVFSLVRKSELNVEQYLDRFHDTGNECARNSGE